MRRRPLVGWLHRRRSSHDAHDQLKALAEHYDRLGWRPSLADLARAAAQLDGSPLADQPQLLVRAAELAVVRHPEADADDVLTLAVQLSGTSLD